MYVEILADNTGHEGNCGCLAGPVSSRQLGDARRLLKKNKTPAGPCLVFGKAIALSCTGSPQGQPTFNCAHMEFVALNLGFANKHMPCLISFEVWSLGRVRTAPLPGF